MTRRLLLLYRFEWRKLLARRLPLAAFAVVVLIAALAPQAGRVAETAGSLIREGRPASPDAFQNGWTALASAVDATRLFLVIVVLILSGSSLAEESAQGTLQSLLVRPVRRAEVLAAKALAIWSYAALLLVIAVGASALCAELSQGLYDVVDPTYHKLTHAYGDMWTFVLLATGLTSVALLAVTALGLLISALFDHPGHATGVAIGAIFLLSALSELSRTSGQVLFVTHLSAPFQAVEDLAGQITNVRWQLELGHVARSAATSAGWGLGLLALTGWLIERRDVTR